jgi:predicted Zn-dependent peptidase
MKKVIFPNGLKLIMEDRPSLKTAAITVAVKAGTINENERNNGIAHFVEHMLFKGTKKRSHKWLMNTVQLLGGSFGGLTQRTYTKYNINITYEFVDMGLDILFDMTTNSAFENEAIERERNVILEEIYQQKYDQPFVLREILFEREINKGALGMSILGKENVIRNIPRDELYSFYKKYYVPNNMVIAVVGNIDQREIEKKIKESFGNLKRRRIRISPVNIKPVKGEKIKIVKKSGLKQAHVVLGGRAPLISEKGRYAMEILISILGQGMNSRLVRKFVNELGIAYYTGGNYNDKEGFYFTYLATHPKNISLASRSLLKEIEKIKKEGVTKREIEVIKNYLKGINALFQESNQCLADQYAITVFTAAEEVDQYEKSIDSVTHDEIDEVIDRFIDHKNYVMVLIRPK